MTTRQNAPETIREEGVNVHLAQSLRNRGISAERDYTAAEREALGDAVGVLGDATVDVYLNGNARWSNVPVAVWNYKLGGYQVLKKWLSYQESKVLRRNLLPEEVQHFTDTARRIAATLGVVTGQYRHI